MTTPWCSFDVVAEDETDQTKDFGHCTVIGVMNNLHLFQSPGKVKLNP